MKKIFIVLLFSVISLFAQYTKKDFILVKTTSIREFKKGIIDSYLQSGSKEKVIAGLLSVSHSEDTSFVNEITKLNFDSYGEDICFALGQIGYSYNSQKYLFNKLIKGKSGTYNYNLFENLGKIADETISNEVLEKFSKNSSWDRNGISIFIFNLSARKISFDKNIVKQILFSELKNKKQERRLDALYVLARLGGSKEAEDIIFNIFKSKDKVNSGKLKAFALTCFARLRYFPDNKFLTQHVITHPDWRVRIEGTKAMSYADFNTKLKISNYFKFSTDKNENVLRQFAISLRNCKTDKFLLPFLNNLVEKCLLNSKFNPVAKGELFISYCTLNPSMIMSSIKKFENSIRFEYILEALRNKAVDKEEAFEYIKNKLGKEEKETLNIAPTLLSFQSGLVNNTEYKNIIMGLLRSEFASVSSTIADGLDSIFVKSKLQDIKAAVTAQIQKYLNSNPHFEMLTSMYSLSEKIDKDFNKAVSAILSESKMYSIKQFLKGKSGEKKSNSKDFYNIEELWKNSFTYTKAVVETEKGEFVIKLMPEYAPISVGNFISLVKRNFYNGVVFHRVVPDFVAQTGDSSGTGFGGPGYDIVSEFSPLPFNSGFVGMASAGRDTEGSQWYVMHNNALHLNGKYTIFGEVIKGFNIISLINQGDKIIKVRLLK